LQVLDISKLPHRNPFIDHPELVDYIWGDKYGQEWFNPELGK
tara:strand:- start:593 stop:718 length:126 start_codon:yes stop_codon:yes gene_type:complete